MTDLRELLSECKVLDLETTINDPNANRFGANPYWKDNTVVARGLSWGPFRDAYKANGVFIIMQPEIKQEWFLSTWENQLFIGHNIGFDLKYVCIQFLKDGYTLEQVKKFIAGLYIWDTMHAEYLLTKQEVKSISLEKLAARYCVPFLKDATVVESFKAGIGADKIDPNSLRKYLEDDVKTTREIMKLQHTAAIIAGGPEYVDYLLMKMRARRATILMELDGFALNLSVLQERMITLGEQIARSYSVVRTIMEETLPKNMATKLSLDSPNQVIAVLFGGEIPTVSVVDTPKLYKTGPKAGQAIIKKIPAKINVKGLLGSEWGFDGEKSSSGDRLKDILRILNQSVMEGSLNASATAEAEVFISQLLNYRKHSKDANILASYMDRGFVSHEKHDQLALPITSLMSLYPNYNHTVTATKRLSCTNPNLMNVSNKDMDYETEEEES